MCKFGTCFDDCPSVFARYIRQLINIYLLTTPSSFSDIINMEILCYAEHPALETGPFLPLLYPCQSPFYCFLQQIVTAVIAARERHAKTAQTRQERYYARLDVHIGYAAALHVYVHSPKRRLSRFIPY